MSEPTFSDDFLVFLTIILVFEVVLLGVIAYYGITFNSLADWLITDGMISQVPDTR